MITMINRFEIMTTSINASTTSMITVSSKPARDTTTPRWRPEPPEAVPMFTRSVSASSLPSASFNETVIMLVVLALIDVVMISNLLIMVIIGGYETFVSRMYLEGHPDQPEWLSHVNASVLKVKLATQAIIRISSIHLLKTFINAQNYWKRC